MECGGLTPLFPGTGLTVPSVIAQVYPLDAGARDAGARDAGARCARCGESSLAVQSAVKPAHSIALLSALSVMRFK